AQLQCGPHSDCMLEKMVFREGLAGFLCPYTICGYVARRPLRESSFATERGRLCGASETRTNRYRRGIHFVYSAAVLVSIWQLEIPVLGGVRHLCRLCLGHKDSASF